MQIAVSVLLGREEELRMPSPCHEILKGVPWGRFDDLFTPAFWRVQTWQHSILETYKNFRLGRSLKEEVAACLLGGYGMPAELGLAAYDRVRAQGFLNRTPTEKELEKSLSEPFLLASKPRHYRFPKQKARHLSACLAALDKYIEPTSDIELRNDLMKLPGIGPKTASWVVRNYTGSDSVAIIDVHILRAGRIAKIFNTNDTPEKAYFKLEKDFLDFSNAIEAKASILDNMMWHFMRKLSRYSGENLSQA